MSLPGVHLVCIDLQPAHGAQTLDDKTDALLREAKRQAFIFCFLNLKKKKKNSGSYCTCICTYIFMLYACMYFAHLCLYAFMRLFIYAFIAFIYERDSETREIEREERRSCSSAIVQERVTPIFS